MTTKAPITTHILDLHLGKPAAGVNVALQFTGSEQALTGTTDLDGRVFAWSAPLTLTKGIWTLRFAIDEWAKDQKRSCFFDTVCLSFKVENTDEHYHVPLLLNEFGYTTYRGS